MTKRVRRQIVPSNETSRRALETMLADDAYREMSAWAEDAREEYGFDRSD